MGKPDVFTFSDYRAYLRAWFDYKAGRPSQSGFARKVRCAPALVSLVLKGERKLGEDRAERWCEQLGLGTDEAAHFMDMVVSADADGRARREAAATRIHGLHRYQGAQRFNEATRLALADWRAVAIIELARCQGGLGTVPQVAAALRPAATELEVADCIRLLEEIGLLVVGDDGRLQADDHWVTGQDVPDDVVNEGLKGLHRALLELAPSALERFPPTQRHFGTLTFAVQPERLPELKEHIMRFEREVMRLATIGDGERSAVVQLGVQLFPLAELEPEGGEP